MDQLVETRIAPGRLRQSIDLISCWGRFSLAALLLVPLLQPQSTAGAAPEEFRAFWVDAWGSELYTAGKISQLVADTRAANMNAIIPQVRRRGDTLYHSLVEPKVTSIDPAFDPLGDLIAKAHNTATGQRLEVHAWLVTYHIWTASSTYPTPPQPTHAMNLHPDWLLQDYSGRTLIDGQYTLDPGHPDVQRHTFDVCMDLLTRYDIDGLNFDYIRYSSLEEGYNPVSVARFNQRTKRTGKPAPNDPSWMQFRREQITGLLRKVYLHALALKPHVRISCDTITWSPAPASAAGWYSTAAWGSVLQDWRGWMEEGILDLNIPMNYFRQSVSSYALAYTNWSNFAKDHKFNRQVAIGPGIYLNSIAGSIQQMRQTRQATAAGRRADGVVGYSYKATNSNGVSRATFINALVSPSGHDTVNPPIFAEPANPPVMTWKTQPATGHLKGFVTTEQGEALDGATVRVEGNGTRSRANDATGFYGFVDLAPGEYTVMASFPGHETRSHTFTVTAGQVATVDLKLPVIRPKFSSIEVKGTGEVLLHGQGTPGIYGLEYTSNMAQWYPLTTLSNSAATFEYTDRPPANTQRFYRVTTQ